MSRLQKLRLFVTQRVNAALEEILEAFEKTIVKYEQEAALAQEVISRQHALLCALHKPLTEVPSPDTFTQQLMVGPLQHQDQARQDPQPSHVRGEPEDEQLPDLDETDIIQFTYKARCSSRPGGGADGSQSKPGSAGSDQDVQLVVSSETEDSEDYSRDAASHKLKPKTTCRPGPFRCRVCSRTFKARRFLLRHIKAHLQDPDQVCGLCGERFQTGDGLRLHIQTHKAPAETRDLQNQTRTQSRERPFDQCFNLNMKSRVQDLDLNWCEDYGQSKMKHRCRPQKKNPDPESLEGTKRRRT